MNENIKRRAEFHDICQMIIIKFGVITYIILAVILLSFFKKKEMNTNCLVEFNIYITLFSFFITICISKCSRRYEEIKQYIDNETLLLIVLNYISSIFFSIGFGGAFAYIIFIGVLARNI